MRSAHVTFCLAMDLDMCIANTADSMKGMLGKDIILLILLIIVHPVVVTYRDTSLSRAQSLLDPTAFPPPVLDS